MRVLLLGGTTEANTMAQALADAQINTVYSYAGRTNTPLAQPLPTRVGGFGGVDGLRSYLTQLQITHMIDATHPFAARMSRNAFTAAQQAALPLIRLERPPWQAQAGDNWSTFARLEDIPPALPQTPARIFLAIGKQQIALFQSRPEHHYLLRLVDTPTEALPLPHTTLVLARGPFTHDSDAALLRQHKITHVIAKNAGGSGARAKLDAARTLGLPLWMVARPVLPGDQIADSVADVMAWLSHFADLGV